MNSSQNERVHRGRSLAFKAVMHEEGDAWKSAHGDAIHCRDVEDIFANAVDDFRQFRSDLIEWKRQFSGLNVAPIDQKAGRLRVLQTWVLALDLGVNVVIAHLEKQFQTFDGSADARSALADAREELAAWRRDEPSATEIMMTLEVDDAGAEEINRIMAAGAVPLPSQNAPMVISAREMFAKGKR